MTPAEWIKERLPSNASFAKVDKTVDQAITDALDANTTDGVADKELALADLLEVLAAEVVFESQEIEGEKNTNELLSARAQAIRTRKADEAAAAAGGGPGAFVSVPIVYTRRTVGDEYTP